MLLHNVEDMSFRYSTRILSNKMLILSEADVRKCCSISRAISANRKALSSLRKDGNGGAMVPTRIGLPYPGTYNINTNNTSSTSSPADWSLFKPAAYYPIETQKTNETNEEILMGCKVVSPRHNNPIKFNKPTVPATTMLLNAETGEVSAIIAATYLTALRTAAGSALATELVFNNDHRKMNKGLSLCIFGAGLQAELHIKCIQHVVDIKKLVIINRSYKRAENLKKMILETESSITDITVVLLSDEEKVKNAVNDADIICTTTNTGTPLFKGEFLKPGCHINGVGSYTPQMAEIDDVAVKRCEVLIDTKEALHVGDLSCMTEESHNFCGLIGDALEGNIEFGKQRDDTDCTVFKSVGTSIQDVISANVVVEHAIKNNIGTRVEM